MDAAIEGWFKDFTVQREFDNNEVLEEYVERFLLRR